VELKLNLKSIHHLLLIVLLTSPLAATSPIHAQESASATDEAKPVENEAEPGETPPEAAPSPSRTIRKPGITVRENYFFQLPGISLSTLTPAQKKLYLERVNTELCDCGCPNDTVARCLVNDRTCTTVKGLAQVVLSEVKAGL